MTASRSVARRSAPSALLGVALGLMLPCTAAGQTVVLPLDSTETNRGPIIPFLEGTDVYWTVKAKELKPWFPNKLEGDIFPHLVVAQNFTDFVDVDEQAKQGLTRLKEVSYAISGTPAVRLRMLRDVSAPVRTPSYMPRVNVQVLWARNFKAALRERSAGLDMKTRPDFVAALARLPSVSLWEAHLIVGHHSNGQDGCITTEQERDPSDSDACAPAGVVPTKENINRIDGSFSTNYLRMGINYSRNWMNNDAPDSSAPATELQAVREARLRVDFEYHPRAWVDEDIVDLYGRARVHLAGAYAARDIGICRKRLEGSAGVVWNPGVVETVPELSGTVQVSCFPATNGGWGFFARLYTGQDYYNIGFLDRITRLHVGATFNQTNWFRFRLQRPDTRP